MDVCSQFAGPIAFIEQMIMLFQRVYDTFLNVFSFLSIRAIDLSTVFAALIRCGG